MKHSSRANRSQSQRVTFTSDSYLTIVSILTAIGAIVAVAL